MESESVESAPLLRIRGIVTKLNPPEASGLQPMWLGGFLPGTSVRPLTLKKSVNTMLGMKLTRQTQLLPTPKDAAKLMATVERFNVAATWLAGVAFEQGIANKFELQKLCYA